MKKKNVELDTRYSKARPRRKTTIRVCQNDSVSKIHKNNNKNKLTIKLSIQN